MSTVSQIKLVRMTTVPLSLKYLLGGQLEYMANYFSLTAISSPGKELEELARLGVKTYAVPMTRKITPLSDLRAVIWLYGHFRKHRPHIVHTHTPKAGLLGMLAAALAGVPFRLHTVAGLPLLERPWWQQVFLSFFERLTYALAHVVLPNSQGLKSIIEVKGWTSAYKLRVIGAGSSNGVNTDFFQENEAIRKEAAWLRYNLQIQPKDFVFLFVGRVVKDKGIEELVSAFSALQQVHTYAKLIIVGPEEEDLDPISPETQALMSQNPGIICTGFREDIRPYLALADVFVLPTYREGFPNVLLQAGCFHLPCIATNINGCNEIIRPTLNGILVPPKQVSPLQEAMQQLLVDDALREAMAAKAREMIKENFDQQEVWLQIRELYRQLLETKGIALEEVWNG
jgi:glycosyltransferase involved in cell wall biosynthesis